MTSDARPVSSDVAFTPRVKAIQARKGSRHGYAAMEARGGWKTEINNDLAAFIAGQRSVFLATANAEGQPYIQHRGGPPGFLRVLDAKTIAFADYKGNRQFISQGNLDADAVDDIMKTAIKLHHHEAMRAPAALTTMAGSMPALGIVACVLGVVKTMGAIDQPPAVLGALIGAALVGTMLGVFLSYGMFEPFAGRLGQIVDEESQVYNVIHQMLVAQFKGHPQPVVIEAARACISHHNQPSFSEVFDSLRGG